MLSLISSSRATLFQRPLRALVPACRFFSESPVQITRARSTTPAGQSTFHPVAKGEMFNGRYTALQNLGSGIQSTVWLVHDAITQEEVAMKVIDSRLTEDDRVDELGILSILRDGNPQAPGREHVPRLLNSFVHDGPNGRHICLILEPLGVSLLDMFQSFNGFLPLILVQRVAKHVLLGLQYVHGCGIIHTDIKGANILMTGAGFAEGQSTVDLEIVNFFCSKYKLIDFTSGITTHQWADLIQPIALRSPEVLICAPWDTKTDIWNFGCIVYEFARGKVLFDPAWQNEETGMDSTQTHLAQMAGLLGDFPKSLLSKGRKTTVYFDESGTLRMPGAYGTTLSDLLAPIRHGAPDDSELPVVDFLSRALIINPDDRWSATQLLQHPWMQNIIPVTD